jgi:hypothetical protein
MAVSGAMSLFLHRGRGAANLKLRRGPVASIGRRGASGQPSALPAVR